MERNYINYAQHIRNFSHAMWTCSNIKRLMIGRWKAHIYNGVYVRVKNENGDEANDERTTSCYTTRRMRVIERMYLGEEGKKEEKDEENCNTSTSFTWSFKSSPFSSCDVSSSFNSIYESRTPRVASTLRSRLHLSLSTYIHSPCIMLILMLNSQYAHHHLSYQVNWEIEGASSHAKANNSKYNEPSV